VDAGHGRTRELYDLWAPQYPPQPHNPLMRAEQTAMLAEWPEVRGGVALDLACGTGRYAQLLTGSAAAQVVAVDFSAQMLVRAPVECRVQASMSRLPFAAAAFNAVISGLAVGHAPDLTVWMSEVARVLACGGTLLFSDFHPQAARAGLTRTFRDVSGSQHTLPHHTYGLADHEQAAAAAQLSIEGVREVRLGYELNEAFQGSEEFYRRWHGLPVVLVVRARAVSRHGC
jgi:malonyl-CoA O-methyltransferase